jgi:hypothetical protein
MTKMTTVMGSASGMDLVGEGWLLKPTDDGLTMPGKGHCDCQDSCHVTMTMIRSVLGCPLMLSD